MESFGWNDFPFVGTDNASETDENIILFAKDTFVETEFDHPDDEKVSVESRISMLFGDSIKELPSFSSTINLESELPFSEKQMVSKTKSQKVRFV